ncbi:uncharacterized protein LOC114828617 [Galendromus occidentalis]|uniref:Serine/threonine-protein kinase greatwall n=1 Tax=Galendromus occidentalis TaxID=34638 RepID=A0AAJ7SHZ9_9ACAR|nr:uncharacterized protein LOC114828617 [Galendromus occidentalis]
MPSRICDTVARKAILPDLTVGATKVDLEATGATFLSARRSRRWDAPSENSGSEFSSLGKDGVPVKSVLVTSKLLVPSKLTRRQLRRIVPSVDSVCHLVADWKIKRRTEEDIFSPLIREEFITEQIINEYCLATDDAVPAVQSTGKISSHAYLALAFRCGIQAANDVRNLRQIQTACRDIDKIFPRLLRSTEVVLDCVLAQVPEFSEDRFPLFQFACSQLRMWIKTIRRGLSNRKLTCVVVEECASCLYEIEVFIWNQDRYIAQQFGHLVRNVIVGISNFASNLNACSNYAAIDYISIADAILVLALPNVNVSKEVDIMTLPKLEDLNVKHLIGAGGFGAVYKAFYSPIFKRDAPPVPCTVKLVASSTFSRIEHAVVTRVVSSVLCHPCIVQYWCVYSLDTATVEIMEYIKGLDLQKVVDSTRGLGLQETVAISAQLIAAITHLHLQGVIHRDIKASNALVTRSGRLKLIDFDTSKLCLAHFPNRVVTEFFKRTTDEFKDGEKAGTLSYMPPEVFCGLSYGRLVDLWAFGITLHKLVVGQTPFRSADDDKLKREVCAAKLNLSKKRIYDKTEANEGLRHYVVNLLQRLLEKDRRNRLGSLSYSEVLAHPFYANVKWEDLCRNYSLVPLDKYFDVYSRTKRIHRRASASDPLPADLNGLSPMASSESRQREDLLRVESLHGKAVCDSRILIHTSTLFRRVAAGAQGDITDGMPSLRRVGFRFPSITEMSPTRSLHTQDILIGNSGPPILGFESIGLTCKEVTSETGRKYCLIIEIEVGSLAEVTSSLIVGDLISHLNGEEVENVTKSTWNRYAMLSVTVLSSSTFRILASCADIRKFFTIPPLTCRISGRRQNWFQKQREIIVRQSRFFLQSTRCWMKIFVLWSAPDSIQLFHGDILLEVNNNSLKGLTEQQVNM